MSFDDLSPMREALSALPLGYVNSSESSLMWVIGSYPDGCFVGIDKLAQMARQTKRTAFANLRNLSAMNLILKEQDYARKGVRQCYRLNMVEIKRINQNPDNERVRLITPNNRVQLEGDKSAVNKPKGAVKSSKGSDTQHPYKEYKNNKYDKELFNEFISGLKNQSLIPYIEAGSNLNDLLKRVIQRDTNFKAFHDYLGLQSFARSEKIGGLVIYFLNEYLKTLKTKSVAGLGVVDPSISFSDPWDSDDSDSWDSDDSNGLNVQFVTSWCGECNELRRTTSKEFFYDSKGLSRDECCICNPVGIELFRHIATNLEPPENKFAYIERVKSVGGAVFL